MVSRLPNDTVEAIRKMRNTPCKCCGRPPLVKTVADKFGVSLTTVANITNRRIDRYVKKP